MKNTEIFIYIIPSCWVFLKVEINKKLVSWEEPVLKRYAKKLVIKVKELRDFLIERDPLNIIEVDEKSVRVRVADGYR